MKSCKQGGFTLVEGALVLSLTAMVMLAVAAFHMAVVTGLGRQSARFINQRQSQNLVDLIDKIATQSTSYSLVAINGVTCLKLVLPANCSTGNTDLLPDQCTPQRLTRLGVEEWGTGYRVWFYRGDATGQPTSNGACTWVGVCPTDSQPSSAWLGGTLGAGQLVTTATTYNSVDSLTFTAVTTTTFSLTLANSLTITNMSSRKDTTAVDRRLLESGSFSRTFFLRGTAV